jgi:NAD(P)-dependent dehydrogenase (short-subunit alcohol dehydrogenase family)
MSHIQQLLGERLPAAQRAKQLAAFSSENRVKMPGVCVVVGASSKWQADGSSTAAEHDGQAVDMHSVPLGARFGIGGGIARRFALEGFTMALLSRNVDNVAALRQQIISEGGTAEAIACELADHGSIVAAFEAAAKLGPLEVLVLNPGYTSHGASAVLAEDLDVSMFDDAHNTQSRGPFLCCQQVLRAMRESDEPCSILMTSVPQALGGSPKGLPNSVSKAGQRGLAQVLAGEYGRFGVHVGHVVINGVVASPGTVDIMPLERQMDAMAVAETFWQLHAQHSTVWTHEVVIQPSTARIATRL